MDDNKNGRQMRFTQEEVDMIRGAFKGNDKLLKVLRKVFLPEIDPYAPVGQVIDLWMTVDIKNQLPEQAMINISARNGIIAHLEQQLFQLQVLANMENPTPEKLAEARSKNSTK